MFDHNRRSARTLFSAGALFALGAATALALQPAPKPQFTELLSTNKTVMGEPIVYPTATPAKLTAGIVTMAPGAETGWHTHGVPLVGLVLDGELTVDYGDRGRRTYKAGQPVADAINVPHNGKNTGSSVMRLFVIYMGAEGLPNSVPAEH